MAGLGVSAVAHALALLAAMSPFSAHSTATQAAPAAIKAVLVAPVEDSEHPGLQPDAGPRWPPGIHPSGSLRIGTLRINLARLVERASMLFPTIVPGLAVDAMFPEDLPPDAVRLTNPSARRAIVPHRVLPPLTLGGTGVQALIDRTWSRHDRWKNFAAIRAAVETHDGNEGDAPRVLFEYSQQNALQPFADSARPDARVWAQIGLAADHTDFVGFIRTYIAAHPNTKSSTELLFLLDQIVQADCDALALFVAPDTDGKLWWTKAAQPDAYAVETRAAEEWSAADAANAPVYGSFLARIDGILRAGRVAPVSAAVSPSVHHAIDRILDDVEVRWLMTSSTRLRKFGYTYDSY